MSLNVYALSLLVTAAISACLAVYVGLRRSASGGTLFALAMAAVTVWSLGYGLELASTDLSTMRAWVMVEYVGITTAPVFWLLFALSYSGLGGWITPWRAAPLFVIPALIVLLNVTNERLHFLYYAAVSLDISGPFPLLAIEPGLWYWAHLIYAYTCVLAGAIAVLHLWLHTPSLYRRQATLLLIGALLPLVVNLAYMMGMRPLRHIDASPMAFTLTGLLITVGIFRYSLFDLSPIARNSLFEDLRDPVLVVDARGRLADLNRAARRALGPTARAFPGADAATALAPWPALVALCAGPGESRAEIRLSPAADDLYDAIGSPLSDRRGRPAGRIVVLHDITERRRAEEERLALERQIQYTQKLESLGVLAGGIAHDFSNLLMAIIGNLDLARFELPPDHPAREPLGDAERSARRAAALTRQLHAYAGKGSSETGPINLSHLVEEIAQLLQVSVGRMIRFELSLDPELPHIEGDAAQLQQVILNLITNASEAIGGRTGTITLTTGVCRCDAAYLSRSRLAQKPPPGPYVYLSVADTGSGMDAEAQQRLFEPFFTTKQHGRGLGMAAVLGIVRGHRGAIMVASAPSEGTCVHVLFPTADTALGPELPEPAAAAVVGGP